MFKILTKSKIAILLATTSIISCNNTDDLGSSPIAGVTKKQVIQNYANLVYANYKQAYDDALNLENAIKTFTTTPTQSGFDNVKSKWLLARESYGTTEAFRFSDGPIDNTTGPEPLMNGWPLDENYIDYVDGANTSGIINNPITFPVINKEILSGANENGGEKNISTGYHAIEFLLWGQDTTIPSANEKGKRPYTDYKVGGTAANQTRRGIYLKVCADLLTDNLSYLVNQWKVNGAYRIEFLKLNEDVVLKNIYTGICTLAGAELATERMDVALGNQDQEDEHSCFSDNTHRDIYLNLKGCINVYNGTYGSTKGASLKDLVNQANSVVHNETAISEALCLTKVASIVTPFDLAISGGVTSTEGQKVRVAVLQLKNYSGNLISGAAKIGITVN